MNTQVLNIQVRPVRGLVILTIHMNMAMPTAMSTLKLKARHLMIRRNINVT